MGVFADTWTASRPFTDDMASQSEKVFFYHPAINRWCCAGFITDSSPDATLSVQIGKTRADMVYQFVEANVNPASTSSYARTVFPLLVPDGSSHRLVVSVGRVSAGTQNVLTCTGFGGPSPTWTARTGPYGSVTYSMTSMCFTGEAIVGGSSSETRIGRSTNLGGSWSSPYDWTATATKVVTDGMGTVLVFTTTGAYIRSTDHGATFTTATLPDWDSLVNFHDCVWALGKFIVLNREGNAWMSYDGVSWELKTRVIKDPSMASSAPQGRAYRNMVACGHLLVAPWGLDDGGATFDAWGLMYTADGYTWHNSGAVGLDFAPATDYAREVHIASSTPAHREAPYTPVHCLAYYPGDLSLGGLVRRGLFSPVEWRGIDGVTASTGLDEVGVGAE
jgi:hypothetical protein